MDKRLRALFEIYIKSDKDNYELEAKFGTKQSITKMEFNNVISRLKTLGFVGMNGKYHLNIQNEFFDAKKGRKQMSYIRTEIKGLTNIQKYCKKNKFNLAKPPKYITFLKKKPVYIAEKKINPVDYHDFGFRINLKEEIKLSSKGKLVKGVLEKWVESKKTFRFIKRFTFTHDDFPLKIDCSIIKSSKRSQRNKYIPTFLITEADIFNRVEEYEIEVEMLPRKELVGKKNVITQFKLTWRYILSGIQGTNYPISYKEMQRVLTAYMNIIQKSGKKNITTQDFVGPSPISLQFINIQERHADIKVSNIREGYTVTEKADGLRKLLFFGGDDLDKKIYLIDMNMKVQFTGCINTEASLYNTIIDGEHVLYNKHGKFINRYLSFDLYYKSGNDYRHFPFIKGGAKITYRGKTDKNTFRLKELHKLINTDMSIENIVGDKNTFSITGKTFIFSSVKKQFNIFTACNTIMEREYDYEIDGLIFTPENTGINSSVAGEKTQPKKKRWNDAFKWKPENYNSVDFLISTKKNNTEDFIGNVFKHGKSMVEEEQLIQYKTLILRVGYKSSYGFLNPCQNIISGTMPKKTSYKEDYKPRPFYPTNPYDNNAHLTNIILTQKQMLTEDKSEVFEDNMIVEFRYDKDAKVGWRWIPIRVRYDKTEDLRRTGRNFGNDYMTAQGVWESIHNPITEDMIRTGENISASETNDEVYYNIQSNKSNLTRPLRDFHNYAKRYLINAVCESGETMIDLAVGKAGDLHKWISAKLSFVFGIDIARDNIENKKDGACARYLREKLKYRNIPEVLFLVGNSGLNIRDGTYCVTPNCHKITDAIFGKGPKDPKVLGAGVYRHYGVGKDGFNIVSCQFAVHYFFKDGRTIHDFLRNVSETCKVGGYFIGTCLDGQSIFNLLSDMEINQSYMIHKGGELMWEAEKLYDKDEFVDDITSLGLSVGIYQESIGKKTPEYLVNFAYFEKLLINYGFQPASEVDIERWKLQRHIGSFETLFNQMGEAIENGTLKKDKIKKSLEMTEEEKQVSFMTRYFVYEKKLPVNAAEVYAEATRPRTPLLSKGPVTSSEERQSNN